jgi:hypothetical protein
MDQCFLKANFGIVVRHSFGVAGAVLSDSNGHIISAVTSNFLLWMSMLEKHMLLF